MPEQLRTHKRVQFTPLQGQYLAFIRTYTLIHRQAPAEMDMPQVIRLVRRKTEPPEGMQTKPEHIGASQLIVRRESTEGGR